MELQYAKNDHPFYNIRRDFVANMVDMGDVVKKRERNLLNNLLQFFGLYNVIF
jgi:hypothetical protein